MIIFKISWENVIFKHASNSIIPKLMHEFHDLSILQESNRKQLRFQHLHPRELNLQRIRTAKSNLFSKETKVRPRNAQKVNLFMNTLASLSRLGSFAPRKRDLLPSLLSNFAARRGPCPKIKRTCLQFICNLIYSLSPRGWWCATI